MLGVVAILDVLGTVVVAALVKFGPSATADPAGGGAAGVATGPAAALPAQLRSQVDAYAADHDLGSDEVVVRAVQAFLPNGSSTTAETSGSGTGAAG